MNLLGQMVLPKAGPKNDLTDDLDWDRYDYLDWEDCWDEEYEEYCLSLLPEVEEVVRTKSVTSNKPRALRRWRIDVIAKTREPIEMDEGSPIFPASIKIHEIAFRRKTEVTHVVVDGRLFKVGRARAA